MHDIFEFRHRQGRPEGLGPEFRRKTTLTPLSATERKKRRREREQRWRERGIGLNQVRLLNQILSRILPRTTAPAATSTAATISHSAARCLSQISCAHEEAGGLC